MLILSTALKEQDFCVENYCILQFDISISIVQYTYQDLIVFYESLELLMQCAQNYFTK